MGVAADSSFWQMHKGDVAAMAVHHIAPSLRHFEENAPLLLPRIGARLLGNVVAVVDNDRYLCEPCELRISHCQRAQSSAAEGYGRWHISLGKWKVERRLERDDGANLFVFQGRAPAQAAAL